MLSSLNHTSARQLRPRRFFATDADGRTKVDRTGTGSIRREYEREFVRRFTWLKRQIKRAIVEFDVLGLKDLPTIEGMQFQRSFNRVRFTRDAGPPIQGAPDLPHRAFEFRRSGDKVASFMDWLYTAERQGILDVREGTPLQSASRQVWQNKYIDTAYQKGIRDAGEKLKTKGKTDLSGDFISGAFNRPVHADRVGLIYTRAFRDLEGITDEMDKQISRSLAQGIAEGRGPQQIARDLVKKVDDIGIVRARTLARTEVIAAHAEATLNMYEEAGIEGVEIEAEFTTAGDDAVCPECEDLEGTTYTIEESRGVIPVHPNCRCAFQPVVVR